MGRWRKPTPLVSACPFNTDPLARQQINAGEIDFIDMHLSHVAQHAWFGFFGQMNVAVIEVLGVTGRWPAHPLHGRWATTKPGWRLPTR